MKRHLVGLGWSGERDRKVERVENDDGEGSKTEPVTEEGNTNRRPISMPASPRTSVKTRRATTTLALGFGLHGIKPHQIYIAQSLFFVPQTQFDVMA